MAGSVQDLGRQIIKKMFRGNGGWHGLLGFLVATAYWPNIAGAGYAPRWVVIAVAVPAALILAGPIRVTAAHWAGTLFVGWCLLTLAWSPTSFDSIAAAMWLLMLASIFCLGSTLEDTRPIIIGFALGMTVSSAIAIVQFSGWRFLRDAETPSGLFVNRNFLAEAAALALASVIGHRLWWLVPGLLPSIMLTQARGATAALAGVIALFLWRISRIATIAGTVALFIALAVASYYGSGLKLCTIKQRLAIWADTAQGITWTGYGLGSYYGIQPTYITRLDAMVIRPDHAHHFSYLIQ